MAQERGRDYDAVVPIDEMLSFVQRCVEKSGCISTQSRAVAEMLVYADERGHFSHGVNRLHIYTRDLATGTTKSDGKPSIVKQKGGTALVDGDSALGPIVGRFCVEVGTKLAKENGISIVTARNSNHYGAAGHYATMAAEKGLIGMAFTNTSPCLFPTRSSEKALGSNPISFFAPATNGDGFNLDMATSTVAYGKIEVAQRKSKPEVPRGWGADAHGVETTKPSEILGDGGLLPVGGVEERGGYKGTGLCMMVEILCGVLSGAHFGKNVREWQGVAREADLGQCYIFIDPECFADGFTSRVQQFIDETRELTPVDPNLPVRVPGDFARTHRQLVKEEGGLVYHGSQIEHLKGIAEELNVELFKYRPFTNEN
uniref:Malate dehydrogenase n=1 Tax=Panagrellus redivivus TaxID=6233 RepID=A0A7E4WDW3_PANRE